MVKFIKFILIIVIIVLVVKKLLVNEKEKQRKLEEFSDIEKYKDSICIFFEEKIVENGFPNELLLEEYVKIYKSIYEVKKRIIRSIWEEESNKILENTRILRALIDKKIESYSELNKSFFEEYDFDEDTVKSVIKNHKEFIRDKLEPVRKNKAIEKKYKEEEENLKAMQEKEAKKKKMDSALKTIRTQTSLIENMLTNKKEIEPINFDQIEDSVNNIDKSLLFGNDKDTRTVEGFIDEYKTVIKTNELISKNKILLYKVNNIIKNLERIIKE